MALKLLLVGCGNMGFAMLDGWLTSGRLAAGDTVVVEPNADLRARAAGRGVTAIADAAELAAGFTPDVIVIAVKPQVIRDVTAAYRRFGNGATTFVSVAAGTPVSTFAEILGAGTPIVRCMPNTPAAIGKGMLVLFANAAVSAEAMSAIRELLSANGAVADIADEGLMDAVTAVSGSGPAYVFHFIECLTDAARKAGLPADIAGLLAMQTVHGAAALAAESRTDPAELRRQVTSPNGTTAAALSVLMGEDRLKALVGEAVEAARLRSIELGK